MSDSKVNWVSSDEKDERNEGSNEESNEWSLCEINNLSEYELIKIMSYFTIIERISFARVCRKWKTIIDKSFKSESVLDVKTVLGSKANISSLAMTLIIKKCCNVRQIVLRGMGLYDSEVYKGDDDSDDNILLSIVNNCQLLQSIDFGIFLELDQNFVSVAKYFKQIKKIVSLNMTESALNSIIDSPNLESIDISRNDNISKLDFTKLGPKIKQLYLMESEVIDESVIRELCSGNGKQITDLSIDIKDTKVLSHICHSMKALKSLNICLYVANCDLSEFSNLNCLRSLTIDVTDTSKFESVEFTHLVQSLQNINLLEIQITLSPINNIAIINESLEQLRNNCKTLEKIVIRRANSLTSAGMYAIAQINTLKHLDLMNCLNIGDGIDIVITSCPFLRYLNLHNCSHISVGTVDVFIEKAKANPNEQFTLDVVDTMVSQDLEKQIPSNMKLIFKFEDCDYDCDHGYNQFGYNSGPDDDQLMDEVMGDFYGEDDDYDYYDDYDDEDYDDYAFG